MKPTSATAQAHSNIALAMVSQGNTAYDDYEAGFAWCEDMLQKPTIVTPKRT